MGALKGDSMARKELVKKVVTGGYKKAVEAINNIKNSSQLEKLMNKIAKMQPKVADKAKTFNRKGTPGGKFLEKRVSARDKKIKESASKFVKRRKQLRGAGLK